MSESRQSQGSITLGGAILIGVVLSAVLSIGLMVVPDLLAPPPQVTVVQAAEDLPVLTIISTTHLTTATMPELEAQGVVTDVAQAVGRVTTQALAKGEAVPQDVLLALPADDWLLSVPISDTVPPVVGETVALLGIQSGADITSLTIGDAVVVLVEDEVVLVAISPDQAKRAAPFLVTPQRLVLVRRWR